MANSHTFKVSWELDTGKIQMEVTLRYVDLNEEDKVYVQQVLDVYIMEIARIINMYLATEHPEQAADTVVALFTREFVSVTIEVAATTHAVIDSEDFRSYVHAWVNPYAFWLHLESGDLTPQYPAREIRIVAPDGPG